MSHHLDRFGNPVYRAKPGVQQRVVRWACAIIIGASLGLMLWGRA